MSTPTSSDDPIKRLEDEITARKAELVERQATLAADEAAEAARAQSTCVYLSAHVVGCCFATTHFLDQATKPSFTFFKPCIQVPQKAQPNVDCIDCKYHTIMAWGQQSSFPQYQKRYSEHGVIFPVVSEELADAHRDLQGEHGAAELRRPAHEVHVLEEYIKHQEAELRHLKVREQERQQTGGF